MQTGISETATRIAVAMAPALAPKGATTDELARACVDLALALKEAMRRPITYGPQHLRIGSWEVDDSGTFHARLDGDDGGEFCESAAECVAVVTHAFEERLRTRQEVAR